VRRLLVLSFVLVGAQALAQETTPPDEVVKTVPRETLKKLAAKEKDLVMDEVAGGDHWRFSTPHGYVHVWRPPGFEAATAGIVVYVHGYNVSVDEAWRDYHLARQFRMSKQNAIFIVPDAPQGNDDGVNWNALSQLFKAVRQRTHQQLPDGEVVVIGHSGAFRTIASWLDNKRMGDVILLDAMYGEQEKFAAWLETVKGHEYHTLIVVASNTLDRADDFIRGFKEVARRNELPDDFAGFTRNQKQARILYIRTQVEHMELVTSEKVIPMLLRVTPLKLVPDAG
jgi:hypothetical protein